MKKIISLVLTLILVLAVFAGCSGNGNEGKFTIGFAKVDISPEEGKGLHLASHNNSDTRVSVGVEHPIYILTIAMTDADGKTMLFVTTDLSWGNWHVMNEVRPMILERFGIASDCALIGGVHNHNAPDYGYSDTYDQIWKDIFKNSMMDCIQMALDDRAPATAQIGRTQAEGMTYSRRYLTKDGSVQTNPDPSIIVKHESEADEEVQLVRFVREGDKKDIVMVNWQTHPDIHGNTTYISADYVGAMRDKVEAEMDVHCVFYQGACGNLIPWSKIPGEGEYNGRGYPAAEKYGNALADVVIEAFNTEGLMTDCALGKISNKQDKFIGKSSWDEANAIACGELSFVTLPVEFSDSFGVQLKEETPFAMTVLLGYHCGNGQYLATLEQFKVGGYEVTNTRYRAGDGEKFIELYQKMLNDLHAAQ